MDEFEEKVAGFTDEQLNEKIANRHKYIAEIVLASLAELQKRGRIFSEEELIAIRKDAVIIPEEVKIKEGELWVENQNLNTPSGNEPELYTRQVIRIFSALFSVFFGSILMAMNLYRTPTKKGIIEVLAFGLMYTVGIMWLGTQIPNIGSFSIIINIAGGYLIEMLFWNKYIGAETQFKKRPFWIPLLIGIGMTALLIFLIISTTK